MGDRAKAPALLEQVGMRAEAHEDDLLVRTAALQLADEQKPDPLPDRLHGELSWVSAGHLQADEGEFVAKRLTWTPIWPGHDAAGLLSRRVRAMVGANYFGRRTR